MNDKPCPFCRKVGMLLPVTNSQQQHWISCSWCSASGPKKPTVEEAIEAFDDVTPPRRPGVLKRLLGGS